MCTHDGPLDRALATLKKVLATHERAAQENGAGEMTDTEQIAAEIWGAIDGQEPEFRPEVYAWLVEQIARLVNGYDFHSYPEPVTKPSP